MHEQTSATTGPVSLERATTGRRPLERHVFLAALTACTAWTVAVVIGATDGLDEAVLGPGLAPRTGPGQFAEAFALLSHPYLVGVVTVTLALRALAQRQRRLAGALVLVSLSVPVWELQRWLLSVDRPLSLFSDSVAAAGSAYPSGHMMAATVLTWVFVTLAIARRGRAGSPRRTRLLGALLIGCAGVAQWAMGTHRMSDLVGGVLLGITLAAAALWLSGVEDITRQWRRHALPQPLQSRAAVIYNPTKVLDPDQFRRRVDFALAQAGWRPPLWLETRPDDTGREMARDAVATGVDLVLVAGGDGTVRTVCAELAGSGVPVGLVPAGTGNLLCRNLDIPLDEDQALDVALHGTQTRLDMVRWTTGEHSAPFAVMAGVGLDAEIMTTTSPRLKKTIKNGAYVVAAAQQLRMAPFWATVTVDGVVQHDGEALMTLVGNVGRLQGGIELIPSASPTDGMLDVLVASGEGARGMARLASGIRRGAPTPGLQLLRGRKVQVRLNRPVAFQLDGDSEGRTSSFCAEVMPAALLVMTPGTVRR